MRIALTALAISTGLNLLLVVPAAKLGIPNPHVFIATATCIGAAVNTYLLWRGLLREGVLTPSRSWPKLLLRVLVANLVMAAFLWWYAGDTMVWAHMPFLERVLRGLLGIAIGAGIYFAVLFAGGLRPRDLRLGAT